MSNNRSNRTGMALPAAVLLTAWWAWTPAAAGTYWLFVHYAIGGIATWKRSYDMWLWRSFAHGSLVWWWMIIGLIGTIVILGMALPERPTSRQARGTLVAAGLAGAGLVVSVVFLWMSLWDNDKDLGRYDNSQTTFVTPSLNAGSAPASLRLLLDGARNSSGKCQKTGKADVPSCIVKGNLPMSGWEPRVSSLDGAKIVMSRTSGNSQRVSLDTDTITYLNAHNGKPALWSAIRDGRGYSAPTEGVVEWPGHGNPTECTFGGDGDRFNRAFGGGHGNSLPNLIAEKYPNYVHKITDVWGYCDSSNKPVLVVPMEKQIAYSSRTVLTDAGVLEIRGSATGDPAFTYRATVNAGDLPGPVYPASLVEQQRTQAAWAAGRKWKNRAGFGYEPSDSKAQEGNSTEFLLESKADHRLYWVTPMTLRNSNSDLFVAYAVSPADQTTSGQLNQMKIYVLSSTDKRQINIDNLESDARNYVSEVQPGFFSSGGKLIEFTPVDGDIWRAFGELNGRVIYRLDISASASIQPKLVSLEPSNDNAGGNQKSGPDCGQTVGTLSKQQLLQCITKFSSELASR